MIVPHFKTYEVSKSMTKVRLSKSVAKMGLKNGAVAQKGLMGSRVCTPGVTEGHVGDEEGGHGSDPQHLPDGGLQVGQPASVAEVGAAVRTHLAVQFLLDPGLNLDNAEVQTAME